MMERIRNQSRPTFWEGQDVCVQTSTRVMIQPITHSLEVVEKNWRICSKSLQNNAMCSILICSRCLE